MEKNDNTPLSCYNTAFGENKGELRLRLVAIKAMIQYFFAAGYFNYDRYGIYYLRSMEAMPYLCDNVEINS